MGHGGGMRNRWVRGWMALGWVGFLGLVLSLAAGAEGKEAPRVNSDAKGGTNKLETATLGGGCFWCLEAVYERLPGVKGVVSGYAGGRVDNPTYRQVCNGDTGHAEVVQVEFDPAVISYEKVLEAFWAMHDPTTLNRQGADAGTQYRSVIMYHSPEQLALAERSKAVANGTRFNGKIVTEIVPLPKFYKAEDYHQDYFRNHPGQPYCQAVIAPKLLKLQKGGVVPKP